MRILIVNNFAHVTGGADLHCLEITEGLRERGHEVRWLATQAAENVETSGGFVPLVVSARNRDELSLPRRADAARRALWNPTAASAMEHLADDFRPDVVHVHKAYVQLSVAPVVIAARRRIPLIQTVHDYEFISASPFDSTGRKWDHDESHFAYQTLNSLTFPVRRGIHRPRINRCVAVSEVVAGLYESIGGIECAVIPNFSAPSPAAPVPRQERDGAVFIGRLTPEKGVGHVLEAARNLPGMRFRIAGDGPMRQQVKDAARSLENVEYAGFVSKEEGGRLIRESLVCLMPSTWEDPGPLACLEAMAEGTPPISYPMGGLAEYISKADAGIVCDRVDSESLIAAVTELESDANAWERRSANGRAAIEGPHSRSRYLDRLESVYAAAAEAPESGR